MNGVISADAVTDALPEEASGAPEYLDVDASAHPEVT